MRVLLFEELYSAADPDYSREPVPTFAGELREAAETHARRARSASRKKAGAGDGEPPADNTPETTDDNGGEDLQDLEVYYRQLALKAVKASRNTMDRLAGDGVPWGHLVKVIEEALPETLDNRNRKAYDLVQITITGLFGPRGKGWHTFKHARTGSVYVRQGGGEDS